MNYSNDQQLNSGITHCPQCGSYWPTDSQFCVCCGYMPTGNQQTQNNPSGYDYCPQCGASASPDMMYCVNCGYVPNSNQAPQTYNAAPNFPSKPPEYVAHQNKPEPEDEDETGDRVRRILTIGIVSTILIVLFILLLPAFNFFGIESLNYNYGNKMMHKGNYYRAYIAYDLAGNYGTAAREKINCAYEWAEDILRRSDLESARKFSQEVVVTSREYAELYNIVMDVVYSNEHFSYWDDSWNGTDNSEITQIILSKLPDDYEDVALFNQWFTILVDGTIHPAEDFVKSNEGLIRESFYIPFVRDYLAHDDVISYFLIGEWESLGGSYYFNMDASLSSWYYFPYTNSKPDNALYYDIQSCEYVYIDGNDNVLARIFTIEIESYDIITVSVVGSYSSYTLYRTD